MSPFSDDSIQALGMFTPSRKKNIKQPLSNAYK